MKASSLTMSIPPFSRSLRLVLRAAGFMATRTLGWSPGVAMSRAAKWIWNAETPASVPAGARISAGKSGSVARSLPSTAVALVNRSPVNCMPSPESPANLTTTRSSPSAVLVTAMSLLWGPSLRSPPTVNPGSKATARKPYSVEGVAAGAAALGHRVVEGEARLLQGVQEVDLGLIEVRDAHPVDHDPDAVLLFGEVLLRDLVVQVHRVAKPRATARLDGHPKGDVGTALLLEQFPDLSGCGFGQREHLCS